MFWRRTRVAIGRFHPAHQQLTLERVVTMSAPSGEWAAVVASLSQHAMTVRRRKWMLPARVATVLVPLIQVLSEDAARNGAIGITADLRGPGAPGKKGPDRDMPVRRQPARGRIRKLTEWFVMDPWLQVRAELADGSVLEMRVTDRIRHRKVHKVTPTNKYKTKTKTKAVQRIDVRRTLARGTAVRRPGVPPPPWMSVRVKEGKRTTLSVTAKLGRMPGDQEQLQAILSVVTELFRWTPPGTTRRTA